MSNVTAIATREAVAPIAQPAKHQEQSSNSNLADAIQIATILAESGMFKNEEGALYTKAQLFAKIIMGQEIGIGPMASVTQIHIIKGKPALDATLIGSRIKQSGKYDYRINELTEKKCSIEFFEHGKSVGLSNFGEDEAKKANLLEKALWKMYRPAMMRARAMTQGARWYCPDVFNGAAYVVEELTSGTGTEDLPTEYLPAPEPPKNGDEKKPTARQKELIRSVYGILGANPASKNKADHQAVIREIAEFFQVDPPDGLGAFSEGQLAEFVEKRQQDPSTQVLEEESEF